MTVLIGGLIVVALAAFFIFGGGKLTTLLKGFVGVFVEDLTKTPEGAAAVYNQAIEQGTRDYSQANDTLQKIAGQLDTAIKTHLNFKKQLEVCEVNCNNFAKNQQWEKLDLFAKEREELLEEIENQELVINDLKPLFEEAKAINIHLEEKLVKLKKDKTRIINDLQRDKQLKNMYDDMDELKNTTNTDKLLDSVKSSAKELREQAVGARSVHNNKTSTKITAAKVEAKKLHSNDYIEQLKQKHGKSTLK